MATDELAAVEQPDQEVLATVAGLEDNEVETALSTRPSMEISTGAASGGFVGSISLPWLQLTHGVGGLFELGFSPGDLVLGKEHLLYSPARRKGDDGSPPLRVIVVDWKQYWKQYLTRDAYERNERPQVFSSEAEAQEAGFTTEWSPTTGAPTAPAAVTMSLLIEKPENIVCQQFCIELDDKMYAPAYMSFDKGAYLSIKNDFGTAVNYICKDRGISSVVWDLTTHTRTAKTGNVTWVPNLKIVEHLTDEQIQAMAASLHG